MRDYPDEHVMLTNCCLFWVFLMFCLLLLDYVVISFIEMCTTFWEYVQWLSSPSTVWYKTWWRWSFAIVYFSRVAKLWDSGERNANHL